MGNKNSKTPQLHFLSTSENQTSFSKNFLLNNLDFDGELEDAINGCFFYNQARRDHLKNKYESALRNYQHSLENENFKKECLFFLGECHMILNNFENAEKFNYLFYLEILNSPKFQNNCENLQSCQFFDYSLSFLGLTKKLEILLIFRKYKQGLYICEIILQKVTNFYKLNLENKIFVICHYYLIFLLKLEKYNDVVKFAEKVLSILPWSFEIYNLQNKAIEYLSNKKLENLGNENQKATIEKTLLIGLDYLSKKNYLQAVTEFSNILDSNPHHSLCLSYLGLSYSYLNELDYAINYYEKALLLNPFDFDILLDTSKCLMQSRKYREALPYLLKANKVIEEINLDLIREDYFTHQEGDNNIILSCKFSKKSEVLYLLATCYENLEEKRNSFCYFDRLKKELNQISSYSKTLYLDLELDSKSTHINDQKKRDIKLDNLLLRNVIYSRLNLFENSIKHNFVIKTNYDEYSFRNLIEDKILSFQKSGDYNYTTIKKKKKNRSKK
jgi:tetratricopeptide (TPR) repeat protein